MSEPKITWTHVDVYLGRERINPVLTIRTYPDGTVDKPEGMTEAEAITLCTAFASQQQITPDNPIADVYRRWGLVTLLYPAAQPDTGESR